MFSLRTLSRFLLMLEALLLAIPSVFGLMIFLSGIFSMLTGMNITFFEYLSCWLGLLTFCALWHLYYEVITERFAKGNKPGNIIQLLTFTGFVLSLRALISNIVFPEDGFGLFTFGILYVPTYLHLLFEIKRQTGKVDVFRLSILTG